MEPFVSYSLGYYFHTNSFSCHYYGNNSSHEVDNGHNHSYYPYVQCYFPTQFASLLTHLSTPALFLSTPCVPFAVFVLNPFVFVFLALPLILLCFREAFGSSSQVLLAVPVLTPSIYLSDHPEQLAALEPRSIADEVLQLQHGDYLD